MLVEDVSAPLRGFQPIGGMGGAIAFAYKPDLDRSVVATLRPLGTLLWTDNPSRERWREEMSALIFQGIQERRQGLAD